VSVNGGTEALMVDSNGRVGIGITAPAKKLHVVDDAGMRITNTAQNRDINIYFNGGIAPTIENASGNPLEITYTQNTSINLRPQGVIQLSTAPASSGTDVQFPS